MSWISWIVVGIIGGFLGRLVVKGEGPGGLFGDMIIGILGAILGGWVYNLFGHVGATGINIPSIICAFIGSVILLLILRAITGRRSV
ncbi:MAG: GlsB/YeaQ/YmgE family stress response membrane protein [Candidatus Eremiobacteraeota bacterium]|nr:GlsB/YeaQ/YmgE family stress response membrane protein [Candidatus Eremiobacteraeota bacterium]